MNDFCEHKDVFPIEWDEFIGAILLGIIIAFCNAAGIGGGGIIVTVGITLLHFTPKEAVAISNTIIFFGCLTRYIQNFKNKHPLKDATSIDYGIVIAQIPLLLFGTFIGVELQQVLPETLVHILLMVTLLYLTWKAIQQAFDTRRKEREAIAKKLLEAHKSINESMAEKEDGNESPNETTGIKDHERFKPLLKTHQHNNDSSLHNISVGERMSVKRMDSRQSMARGPEISIDTKGVDIDDKLALTGERKSTYFANDLNPVLEDILKWEKSHFRPRTILVVLI